MRFDSILFGFRPKQIALGLAAVLALGAFQLVVTPAHAQTPDGMTPADEKFSDDNSFDGQLRGLCNAFCEAMDCDSLDAQARL